MKVAVTGANGYVGGALAARLRADGHEVLRLVRRPEGPADAAFSLGGDVDPGLLRGVDALVHAAYDFRARGEAAVFRANVDGSARLFDAAARAFVKRLVFVSSVSAFPGCASVYGRGKLAVEKRARESGGTVVRPGLVWDASGRGMYGSLRRLAGLPLLPVFDGGVQPLVLVHADDLARALAAALTWPEDARSAPVIAAHPEPVSFHEILARLAAARGKRLRAFSVPGALGLAGLRALEALGLPLRFRSDSLVSLLNPDPAMDFRPARRLGLEFRPFKP